MTAQFARVPDVGHNILLCNSDKDLADKTFRCEGYVSDQEMTEDPEALINEEKCFLTKRNREPSKEKPIEDQKEEAAQSLRDTYTLTTGLGFIIKESKSRLIPSQKITFLGADIDIQRG